MLLFLKCLFINDMYLKILCKLPVNSYPTHPFVLKGRSGNAWISPLGSMMFTLPLPLSPVSRLAHHLPLLQHMVGVAVVHSIRTLPGYEGVPLRIKWPNVIYHEGRVKLGGILVSCVTVDKICMAVVGECYSYLHVRTYVFLM